MTFLSRIISGLKFGRATRSRISRVSPRPRLHLESLEDRCVPAAGLTLVQPISASPAGPPAPAQQAPKAPKAPKAPPPSSGGSNYYPIDPGNPLTSVAFNESDVLVGSRMDAAKGTFEVWYSDEHALALGVRQVNVITAGGTATTNYPVSPLTPSMWAHQPAVGTTATAGDQAGTDASGRPIAPSLYVTDITDNPNSRSGDWQYGGTAIAPSDVFGTWKAFTRTVDRTTSQTTVTADADPARNGWNLGAGSDAPPAGATAGGYGAEIRWNLSDLSLIQGHNYRFYVIVHDGDQNKTGGDAGQAVFTTGPVTVPGTQPASLAGFVFDGTTGSPIAGVTLNLSELINGQMVAVASTTTAADGSYSFTNLQPGTYVVTQTPPLLSGYFESTSAHVGTVNGLADGSVGGTSDVLTMIVLASGAKGIDYDFTDSFFAPNS